MTEDDSRWPVLGLVTLAHALGSLAVLSVAPLMPFLHEAFHLSRVQVGLLLPAVYLGGVLMSLPAGWLSDRYGVRRTLAVGEAFTGAMVLLAALAWGFGWLLAALLVAGFGFSVLNPSTGKAILEWFPPRRRGVRWGSSRRDSRSAASSPRSACHRWRRSGDGAGRSRWRARPRSPPPSPSRSRTGRLRGRRAWRRPRARALPRSRRSSAVPVSWSCSSAAWRSRAPSPRCWPTSRSTPPRPSGSRRWTPRGSWPWPRSAGPRAVSAGASPATGSSAAVGVPESSRAR